MDRVQIPVYTDRWMMGDRFGKIVKITSRKSIGQYHAANSMRARILTDFRHLKTPIEIAHVKLDKSGKTVRVILIDCTVI